MVRGTIPYSNVCFIHCNRKCYRCIDIEACKGIGMWLGKIAIIMYLFSISLLFSGYFIDNAYGLNLFSGITFDSLDVIANKQVVDQEISVDLIFGDFIAGVRVMFGIITGDTIAQAFTLIPSFDEMWLLLVRIIFTLSSAMLWIFVVTGRSV